MSNKVELLKRLTRIEQSSTLTAKFRKRYMTDFEIIRACIVGDLIKKSAINFIIELTEPIEYSVTWNIEVEAYSPEDAAKLCLGILQDKDSMAKVFTVEHYKENEVDRFMIDLSEEE